VYRVKPPGQVAVIYIVPVDASTWVDLDEIRWSWVTVDEGDETFRYSRHASRYHEVESTFKVILSRYHSPILFPLSFIPPFTWYVCLVLDQNGHTVSTSCLIYQKYCSFINYALNHYQAGRFHPVTASGLDPSLHFVGLLCCLHVVKPFLVLSSCSALGRKSVSKYLYLYLYVIDERCIAGYRLSSRSISADNRQCRRYTVWKHALAFNLLLYMNARTTNWMYLTSVSHLGWPSRAAYLGGLGLVRTSP